MSTPQEKPARIQDPVFLCMIGAIILAVVSSIALRAYVNGAGPNAARGETPADPLPPARSPHPDVHAEDQ
ncbi:MAG TPA: hypothetical protein VHM90_18340 [Phycisphaerae bacterium]|jgi:hypothetical protein|nr:hypothetical protein [Phycisphaerae bacterium]